MNAILGKAKITATNKEAKYLLLSTDRYTVIRSSFNLQVLLGIAKREGYTITNLEEFLDLEKIEKKS